MWHDADLRTHGGRTLLDRFRPRGATASQNFLPILRAYGGLRVPDAYGESQSTALGRRGTLEIRLAQNAKDVRRAQELRYRVFYEEMSALADAKTRLARRDIDAFDAVCEHLLVLDHAAVVSELRRRPRVIGTYRLLRQDIAARHGGFYSAQEFGIEGLLGRHQNLRFLELGRSCVLAPYRNKRTVDLLWHGIWAYVLEHRIDVMFGCASLEGIDPDTLAPILTYLHHFHSAPAPWRTVAVPKRYVGMNRLPITSVDRKAAWRDLPPLIKGYLRLGAYIGDGAVLDHQFGTTDVLIVLPVAAISARYIQHFGPAAERYAA